MDERIELDRYLYDLQGYLVIEDVLTVDEVAELNALVDQHIEPVPANWAELAKSKNSACTTYTDSVWRAVPIPLDQAFSPGARQCVSCWITPV